MPLLRKKPFQRLHVSSDFRDNDEVFHCEVTNEIFKDFNEFCERIILCNSLVWSCSITGKSNLTYEDALRSEENAKKSMKEFPLDLRIPILYLAHKTSRTSFNEMIDDVYQYARDRYFIGEMVEACFKNDNWCECLILQVLEPTEQQIKAHPASDNANSQERQFYPPAKLFRYEVEAMDNIEGDEVSAIEVLDAHNVRRRKHQFSREKNRIFLRCLSEQNNNGIWVIKENVLQKHGILKTRFDSIFAGPLPDFTYRPKKVIKQKQECIDKFLVADITKHRTFPKPDEKKMPNKKKVEKKSKEELQKAKAEELNAKKLQQKMEAQERRRRERKKKQVLQSYLKAWDKPRDDLECEDLEPLPEPVAVNCEIPNEKFGNVAMILEFLWYFHEQLEVKKYFPNGMTLELLERAMLKKETSGPWSDLVQLLLANIFKYHEEEEDEIRGDEIEENNIDSHLIEQGVSSLAEAAKLATIASAWAQSHQGCQLSDIEISYVSLSELLRQHFLSSGGRIGDAASSWRYSQRGGYTNQDDSALHLRINDPRILRLLGHRNVCEFEMDDKLKIITCLMNQLLTFASIRDIIEERYEKVSNVKKQLKQLMKAEQKRLKEEKEKAKEQEKEGKGPEEAAAAAQEYNKLKKSTRHNVTDDKKKEELLMELKEASRDHQMMLLLGFDRAHRRYWKLTSIPGIFVENNELWPGTCISGGTPLKPELRDKTNIVAYLMSKAEQDLLEKENSFSGGKKSPKKSSSFHDKNGLKSPRKDSSSKKESKFDMVHYNELRKKVTCCTGNIACPVHWKTSDIKWSFFSEPEDIFNLIQSLNKRGFRERELRNNLEQEAEHIASIVKDCPKHKLNPDLFSDLNKEPAGGKSLKKSRYDNPNLGFPADMPVDTVMEMGLRDNILEVEEKLWTNSMGALKVNDRDAWRKAISNGGYDKQCEKVMMSGGAHDAEADSAMNSALDKIKVESRQSRPNTPDSEVSSASLKMYIDPGMYLGPPGEDEMPVDQKQRESIKKMACAILQVLQAVDSKYLKGGKPFGNDPKDKKWSGEEFRERWEQSLLASTSWSQLYVHLHTLDASIPWNKACGFNACCRICKRKRDPEKMLLCDGCNKGQHLYCLKPKLTAVPEGDWFCNVCRPPQKQKTEETKKRRRKFEEEEVEEELLEDVPASKGPRQSRSKRALISDDEDEDEDEEEEEPMDVADVDFEEADQDEDDESEEAAEKPPEICSVCSGGGRMFSCDTCHKHFHLKCVRPALGRAPRGRWSCFSCKAAKYNHTPDGSSVEEKATRQSRRSLKTEERMMSVKEWRGALSTLLADVESHRESWPFMAPVTKDEVPDYHNYIKRPMDFGTIKSKFDANQYETLPEFFADCKLVFNNCETYNQENSAVYKAGTKLLKYFEKRCKELNLNLAAAAAAAAATAAAAAAAPAAEEKRTSEEEPASKKRKMNNGGNSDDGEEEGSGSSNAEHNGASHSDDGEESKSS